MKKKSLIVSALLLFTFLFTLAFSINTKAADEERYTETIETINDVINVKREYHDYSYISLKNVDEKAGLRHIEFKINYMYGFNEDLETAAPFTYTKFKGTVYLDMPGNFSLIKGEITTDPTKYEFNETGKKAENYEIESKLKDEVYNFFNDRIVYSSFLLTEDKVFNSHLVVEYDVNYMGDDYHYEYIFYSEELSLQYKPSSIKVEHEEEESENKITRTYHIPTSVICLDKKMIPPYSYDVNLDVVDISWLYQEFKTIDGFDISSSTFSIWKDFYGTSTYVDTICWPGDYAELYNGKYYTEDYKDTGLGDIKIGTYNNVKQSFDVSAHIDIEGTTIVDDVEKTLNIVLYLENLHVDPIKDEDLISLNGYYYIENVDESRKEFRADFTSFINVDLFKYLPDDNATADIVAKAELIANGSISFGELEYTEQNYWDSDNNYIETISSQFEIVNIPSEPIDFFIVLSYTSGGEKYSFTSNTVTLYPLELTILVDDLSSRNEVSLNEEHILSVALNTDFSKEEGYLVSFSALNSDEIDIDPDTFQRKAGTQDFIFNCNNTGDVVVYATFMADIDSHMTITFIDAVKTLTVKSEIVEYIDINDVVDVKYGKNDCELFKCIDSSEKYIESGAADLYEIKLNTTNYMLLGGKDILIYVNIPGEYLADDLVYEWSLANEKVNTVKLIGNQNIAAISACAPGKQKIMFKAHGKTVGLVQKEIFIEVIDLASADIKISYDNSLYHKSEENIKFTITINGISDFLNLDVTWTATNKDGEYDNLEIVGSDMILLSPKESDYYVNASIDSDYMFDSIDSKTNKVKVRTNIPENLDLNSLVKVSYTNINSNLAQYIDPEKATSYVSYFGTDLTEITSPNAHNLILGGKDILLYIDIPTEYLDDELVYVWGLAFDGVNAIKLTNNQNVALISTQTKGTQRVTFKVNIDDVTIYKEINFEVIDLSEAEIKISYKDEFHKSAQNVKFNVSINGRTDFLNLDVIWNVTNNDGDYTDIEVNGTEMTLLNPGESDYIINASIGTNLNSFNATTDTVKVRNIDMDKLVSTLLPIFAVVLVILVGLAIFLKKYWEKIFTLEKRLNKALAKLEAINPESESFVKDSKKLLFSLKACLDKEESLNVDRLGQFDSFINITKTGINIVKSMIKNDDKLNYEKRKSCLTTVKEQYILKLLKLTADYEEAEKKFKEAALKSGKTAITYNNTPDNKKSSKKEK